MKERVHMSVKLKSSTEITLLVMSMWWCVCMCAPMCVCVCVCCVVWKKRKHTYVKSPTEMCCGYKDMVLTPLQR
jgi:hypothetical protein